MNLSFFLTRRFTFLLLSLAVMGCGGDGGGGDSDSDAGGGDSEDAGFSVQKQQVRRPKSSTKSRKTKGGPKGGPI